jgi:ribosome biogenesis GTPase
MESTNINDRGVVFKKTIGQYHIHAVNRALSCVLSSRLRKIKIFKEVDPRSHKEIVQKDRTSKHIDPVAVGDEVRFADNGDGTGRILEILPRRNKLVRPATGPGLEIFEQVIASNLDQVVPVFSTTSPIPKWGLLDRYLVSAEAAGLPSLICITKIDLAKPDAFMRKILDEYRAIGYPVHHISAVTGEGMDSFKAALQGRVSVLVGKSGVGKTSLLNALQPSLELRVGEVTRGAKGKGRHTTTHLEMFSLDSGIFAVDTPGIREFGLWDIYDDELAWFFPEMRPFIGLCKFGLDCLHDEEPGCAIRSVVMTGAISPRRYKSYMRFCEELQ